MTMKRYSYIAQSSIITRASPLVSYPGHSLEKSYPYAEDCPVGWAVEYTDCTSAEG